MFWNDPMLYGATFPFKDIPQINPQTLTPQTFGQLPAYNRFVPPTIGYQTPPVLSLPQTTPYNPINPIPPTFFAHVNPYWNTPIYNYNWTRPFFC